MVLTERLSCLAWHSGLPQSLTSLCSGPPVFLAQALPCLPPAQTTYLRLQNILCLCLPAFVHTPAHPWVFSFLLLLEPLSPVSHSRHLLQMLSSALLPVSFLPASVFLFFIHSSRPSPSICSLPSTVLGARIKDEKAKILPSRSQESLGR